MPHKSLRHYVNSHKAFRLELLAILFFLFWALAAGSTRFPREIQAGFTGLCAAGLIFILGPFVGFGFYFPTTFFRSIPLPGFLFSLNQVVGVMFVLSWANWLVRGKLRLPRGRLTLLMSLLFIYFLVNCLLAQDFSEGLYHGRYLSIYFFIALALASIMRTRTHCRAFFWIILLASAVSASMGAFELITGIDILTKSKAVWMGRVRINGAAPNSIVFAYQLLYAFPLGYYLFSEEENFTLRFLALGLSIFITIIALFTFNRQTILLVGFTYILAAMLYRNRYSRIFMGIVIMAMLLSGPYVLHLIWSRLETVGQLHRDRSLTARIDGLKVGANIIRRHPFMGLGLGCYHIMWWNYLPEGKTRFLKYEKVKPHYPDMGYNQLLAEGGIIGLGLALWFFIALVRALWRYRKQSARRSLRGPNNLYSALFTMMLIFLLSSVIQDTFLYVRTWIMFGLILASLQKTFWAKMAIKEVTKDV